MLCSRIIFEQLWIIDHFQVYIVKGPEEVHLGNKTYCRKFDVIGIPCEHAMVCIAFCYYDTYAYCKKWVITTKFRATYNDKVHPTRRKEYWPTIADDNIPFLSSVGLNLKEEEKQEENHNVVEKLKSNAKMQAARSLCKEMQECVYELII